MTANFEIPVVLMMYNRPLHVRRMWATLRQLKPRTLYVVSDGPKKPADEPLVADCRSIIQPDWDVQLTELYSQTNLGCRANQIRGLTNVFSAEETAIVLEDDLVVSPCFFEYCKQLLMAYANDNTIFAICGTNQWQSGKPVGNSSIRFSRYFSSCGWASWRRSWNLCDWNEKLDPAAVAALLAGRSLNQWVGSFWEELLSQKSLEERDSWAYQYNLAALRRGLYTIFPSQNLIEHVGVGADASHAVKASYVWPKSSNIELPLKIPATKELDDEYDNLLELRHYDGRSLSRLRRKLKLGTRLRATVAKAGELFSRTDQ